MYYELDVAHSSSGGSSGSIEYVASYRRTLACLLLVPGARLCVCARVWVCTCAHYVGLHRRTSAIARAFALQTTQLYAGTRVHKPLHGDHVTRTVNQRLCVNKCIRFNDRSVIYEIVRGQCVCLCVRARSRCSAWDSMSTFRDYATTCITVRFIVWARVRSAERIAVMCSFHMEWQLLVQSTCMFVYISSIGAGRSNDANRSAVIGYAGNVINTVIEQATRTVYTYMKISCIIKQFNIYWH